MTTKEKEFYIEKENGFTLIEAQGSVQELEESKLKLSYYQTFLNKTQEKFDRIVELWMLTHTTDLQPDDAELLYARSYARDRMAELK